MKVLVPAASSALGLSLDSVDELVRLARAGVPYRELAVRVSCALSTVYEHLGAATLVLRHHRAAHHLRVEEREEIRAGLVRGDSLRVIARILHRNVSCLSREVERNGGRSAYRAYRADQRAVQAARRPRSGKIASRAELRRVIEAKLEQRGYRTPVERLLFALVANRALDPGSKLSVESWVADEAHVEGLPEVDAHQLYRAMDFLLEAHDEVQREVFWSVANLFNLEVDLLFLDTTTAYFEIEGEDPDSAADDGEGGADDAADELVSGLRKRGHSKDSRPNQAQVVIGFAVTRDGIPVRCWVWPGNTADVNVVEEVKRDLNEWKLGRVMLVMDAGFNSEANRRILQGAGDAADLRSDIIGERLRAGSKGEVVEAARRAGRYKTLPSGLRVKEVTTQAGSVAARRFVIVHNPEQERFDRERRDDIVRETERRLAVLGDLTGKAHSKAACALRAHPTYGRYVRQSKTGKLAINRGKIATEAKLDGKFLVSTSDPHLSTEDIALGYKQLHEIERVNRDLKHTVDIRPVHHRREDRIRAHVLLCWLALLLIRVIENGSRQSWHQLKKLFRPLMVAQHATKHGLVSEANAVTSEQKSVLDALRVKPPARFPNVPTDANL